MFSLRASRCLAVVGTGSFRTGKGAQPEFLHPRARLNLRDGQFDKLSQHPVARLTAESVADVLEGTPSFWLPLQPIGNGASVALGYGLQTADHEVDCAVGIPGRSLALPERLKPLSIPLQFGYKGL